MYAALSTCRRIMMYDDCTTHNMAAAHDAYIHVHVHVHAHYAPYAPVPSITMATDRDCLPIYTNQIPQPHYSQVQVHHYPAPCNVRGTHAPPRMCTRH